MMNTIIDFFISKDFLLACISGVVAAGIFYILMRSFKPRIKASPCIIKNKDDEGNFRYYFKFYNASFSNIENVSLELYLMEDYHYGTGKNLRYTKLDLSRPNFNFLSGINNKNKDVHDNCVIMRISDDLEEMWDERKEWLQLQIDATNASSGRRSVFVKNYKDPKNSIKEGRFDSGQTFKII